MTLSKPGPPVRDFEISEGPVEDHLRQVEFAMSQVTRMRISEGLRYLNYEQVDHLHELARDRCLKHTKLGLPEVIENVIVAIAVLSHLHEDIIVLEDFVGGYNMRCLRRQIDPRVDD